MTEPAFGVDLSVFDGEINWAKMIAGNVKFAFIRAKYGTFTDRRFGMNWPGAKAAGLLRGAYLFYRPANDASATQQAEAFVSVLGGDRGELPVVVDVEHDRRKDGSEVPPPPFSVLEPGLRACLTRITQLMGRKPIIYTRASYWNQFLGALPWTQDYDLWVANWVAHWTPTSRPRLPRGWATYRFWQYSGDGNGQGASLGVSSPDIDLNLFNGDLNALRDYAAGHPIVMPPERTMWVIAVSGLNFRSRPIVSAATLIAKLPFATQLTAIGKETSDAQGNKWQRVRLLDGRIGFVCAFLASIGQRFLAAQPPATAVQLIVTKPGAALRDRPVNGSLLARLKLHDALMLTDVSDASVMHIGTRGQWLAVTDAQGRVGYVSAQNVELAPKPK